MRESSKNFIKGNLTKKLGLFSAPPALVLFRVVQGTYYYGHTGEIRTLVARMKTSYPSPLDDGAIYKRDLSFSLNFL